MALDLVTEQLEIGSKDPTTISDDELEDIKDRVTDFLECIIEDYIYGGDLNEDLGRSDE